MIDVDLGEAEVVLLPPGLRVFPAQPLTGCSAAPADVVRPGTGLILEYCEDKGRFPAKNLFLTNIFHYFFKIN